MNLSIIIPSIGRLSLLLTLQSIRPQLHDDDEVIVVFDGQPDKYLLRDIGHYAPQVVTLKSGPHGDWGATPRTIGQGMATGDLLLWMDDDDEYTPNALETVRVAAMEHPAEILLFQMRRKDQSLVWNDRRLKCGNISTQCVAVPNGLPLGRWGTHYAGDFDFIKSTCDLNAPPVWIESVICNYGR